MPNGEDHGIVGFPIAPGLAFACMAEGIILALEHINDRSFTGDITPEHVRRISTLAKKHGFALADYKRQAVLGAVHAHV